MRIGSIVFLAISLCSCYGMAHYTEPPIGVEKYGTGTKPINPDVFRVKTKDYRRYRAAVRFNPPPYGKWATETVPIEVSDTWKVTHKVGQRYIIQSDEYNKRQCRFLSKRYNGFRGGHVNIFGACISDYEYGIYVNAEGEIDGGWEILSTDFLNANRYMYMFWHPAKNNGWPKGVIFLSDQRVRGARLELSFKLCPENNNNG